MGFFRDRFERAYDRGFEAGERMRDADDVQEAYNDGMAAGYGPTHDDEDEGDDD